MVVQKELILESFMEHLKNNRGKYAAGAAATAGLGLGYALSGDDVQEIGPQTAPDDSIGFGTQTLGVVGGLGALSIATNHPKAIGGAVKMAGRGIENTGRLGLSAAKATAKATSKAYDDVGIKTNSVAKAVGGAVKATAKDIHTSASVTGHEAAKAAKAIGSAAKQTFTKTQHKLKAYNRLTSSNARKRASSQIRKKFKGK